MYFRLTISTNHKPREVNSCFLTFLFQTQSHCLWGLEKPPPPWSHTKPAFNRCGRPHQCSLMFPVLLPSLDLWKLCFPASPLVEWIVWLVLANRLRIKTMHVTTGEGIKKLLYFSFYFPTMVNKQGSCWDRKVKDWSLKWRATTWWKDVPKSHPGPAVDVVWTKNKCFLC